MDWFSNYDDRDFVRRFRLSKASALYLLERIEADLEYSSDRNTSVLPMGQLLTTVRFYATGCSQLTMGDYMGISKSTIHRIIQRMALSTHHNTIFNNNNFVLGMQCLREGNMGMVLLVDGGKASTSYMVAPLENPRSPAGNLYNTILKVCCEVPCQHLLLSRRDTYVMYPYADSGFLGYF
ncbi:Putative nuclease HARBI1 [Gryllus bimaculatus]|nr:Putative nuclease HARBI1 [Gryllus bimaculatus]